MFINPQAAGIIGFVFFYLSLFLALVGTFSLLGISIRFLFKRNEILYKQINASTRQSILLSILLIITLILQSQNYLYWWDILIVIFILSFIELFFVSLKKFNRF